MILKLILIIHRIISNINLHLIMFLMMKPSKVIYITRRQDYLYVPRWRAIMPLFLHMGRLELVKLIPWKVLSIIFMMRKEESSPGLLRIYSNIFRGVRINRLSSWSELLTYKYIMKSSAIF